MKKVCKNGCIPEEQVELLKNPYTRTVTDSVIKFTDEFNDLFIKRRSQGVGPSMIFKDCGYDLSIIGRQTCCKLLQSSSTNISLSNTNYTNSSL